MPRSFVAVRKISEAESAVLVRSLSVAAIDDIAQTLIKQVHALQIVGCCGCGCASVDFLHPTQGQKASVIADADATTALGEYIGILVWAIDNKLSGLELYSYSDTPAQLPVLDSISMHGTIGSGDPA
jgi:hypothetical protein